MIRITDDYYCKVDEIGNYILQKDKHKKDKKGNNTYTTLGYFGSLSKAIIGLKRIATATELTEIDCELDEAIKIINDNNKRFELLLKNSIQD